MSIYRDAKYREPELKDVDRIRALKPLEPPTWVVDLVYDQILQDIAKAQLDGYAFMTLDVYDYIPEVASMKVGFFRSESSETAIYRKTLYRVIWKRLEEEGFRREFKGIGLFCVCWDEK